MDHDNPNIALLQASLSAAVPIEAENMRRLPLEEVMRIGKAQIETIASKGDIILFRSKKKGETAAAFASLARAVAAASFVPGGVRVFGLKFVNQHPDQQDGST